MKLALIGKVTDCIQLTYRTPAESVRDLLPDGLELITRGPWAFWNVMACQVERIRPAHTPGFVGLTYHHVGYRLLTQAMTHHADVIKGLYFTRSDVSARAVSVVGGGLTDLKMHPATITSSVDDCRVTYEVAQVAENTHALTIEATNTPARLMHGSCFPSTEDARQFSRYRPNGLAVSECAAQRQLRITRVSRSDQAWCETPLAIHRQHIGYFDAIGQSEHTQLEWACRLGPMEYRWHVGENIPLLMQPSPQPEQARLAV